MKPKRKQRQAAKVYLPSSEIPVEESVPNPSNDPLPSEEVNISQAKEIAKLKKRVKKLEKRRKSRSAELRRLKKVDTRKDDAKIFGVDDLEGNEVFVDVREKTVEKEVSTVDLVTTAGEVVTAASVEDNDAPTTATIADVNDELTLEKTLIEIKAAKPEDKGKVRLTDNEKPLKKKDQIALDEEVARKLEAEMIAEIVEEERIAREKDEANKVVIEEWDDVQATIDVDSFDDMKKIFDKVYKKMNTFVDMETENVEESLKKTKTEGSSKRAELKRCLEIVSEDNDDVAIEATPLSSKSPTNFNKEDLEVLRSIVKERFKKTKPVDDMYNLLFQTLKTMFEPHVEDIIWKYQQGVVKVNNWKLFDSCGVYCVTTKSMVYYLLAEKMYPFTSNVLHQLCLDVRHQVDYEIEMAYDLLRLIRRQINEGYNPE
nr:hypothetical protein [Tanacetum cinerariifolium]